MFNTIHLSDTLHNDIWSIVVIVPIRGSKELPTNMKAAIQVLKYLFSDHTSPHEILNLILQEYYYYSAHYFALLNLNLKLNLNLLLKSDNPSSLVLVSILAYVRKIIQKP